MGPGSSLLVPGYLPPAPTTPAPNLPLCSKPAHTSMTSEALSHLLSYLSLKMNQTKKTVDMFRAGPADILFNPTLGG